MSPVARWSLQDLWTLLSLIVLSVAAFWSAWTELATEILRREDNGYILIVPFVAAYLTWIRRSRFRYLRRRPSLFGPCIFILAACMGWLGTETDTRVAIHGSAVLSLVACFVTLGGFGVVKVLAPVFLCLLFLLPVPGEIRMAIASPLQHLAVLVTHDVLSTVGVPCEREGISILIDEKEILVGEACDGMRMVFALALTFFAFVFSIPLRMQARVVLLVASPFVALFCNMIRLIATGFAYAYSTSEFAEEFHDIAGWLMLPLAILMLQGIVRFMRWLDLPVYTWRFLQA
jgi:exosortase